MIQIQAKRFQVVLWENEDRLTGGPALRLDFDSLDAAQAAFDEHRSGTTYLAGVVLEWHKESGIWNLLAQFPGEQRSL